MPWAANINDPWDQHLFPNAPEGRLSLIKRCVSNYWLRRTLRSADVVTFPCRRLADYHARVSGVKRERAVLLDYGVVLEELRPPRGIRLRGARRALRVRPAAASAVAIEGGIELRFALPPGSYATVLVEELFGEPARERPDDMRARAGVS